MFGKKKGANANAGTAAADGTQKKGAEKTAAQRNGKEKKIEEKNGAEKNGAEKNAKEKTAKEKKGAEKNAAEKNVTETDGDREETEQEEKRVIRHTITAEEAFTLAKDVFDIRTFLKNVYANRAVIARRINIVTLCVSCIFTLLYAAFVIFTSLHGKLELSTEITLYALCGAFALMTIILIVVALCGNKAGAKNAKKVHTSLAVIRLVVRLLSIAVAISAIYLAVAEEGYDASSFAVDVLLIVFSVFTLIIQFIPLLFGGIGKFVRWLLSPVKIKMRFPAVALEWYQLNAPFNKKDKSARKISKKYYDAVGNFLDSRLLPAVGNKYITTIKPVTILNLAESFGEERPLAEGVLKSIFAYAEECGYVVFNPCRDLAFEGSVEEEPKQKKTMRDRFFSFGKKIGMSMLDKYIISSTAATDDEDK